MGSFPLERAWIVAQLPFLGRQFKNDENSDGYRVTSVGAAPSCWNLLQPDRGNLEIVAVTVILGIRLAWAFQVLGDSIQFHLGNHRNAANAHAFAQTGDEVFIASD